MPRHRRRRDQSLAWVILLVIVVVLWYMGKIPGLPPFTTVVPNLKDLGTVIAPAISVVTPAPSISAQPLGRRTKTSGCVASDALPDSDCTPGAVFPDITREQVCTAGYASQVRDVPESVKDQVYSEYGITSHEPGQYEVDHLISLELGGSNSIANLWPEPADPRPGFHEKDQVENYLHSRVCDGALSLQEAQSLIARDWFKVYEGMPK